MLKLVINNESPVLNQLYKFMRVEEEHVKSWNDKVIGKMKKNESEAYIAGFRKGYETLIGVIRESKVL